jgi:hypothetical protein|nr:MAG: hypothetical protein DIU62_02950 [Pseudomonadota bacterium]
MGDQRQVIWLTHRSTLRIWAVLAFLAMAWLSAGHYSTGGPARALVILLPAGSITLAVLLAASSKLGIGTDGLHWRSALGRSKFMAWGDIEDAVFLDGTRGWIIRSARGDSIRINGLTAGCHILAKELERRGVRVSG